MIWERNISKANWDMEKVKEYIEKSVEEATEKVKESIESRKEDMAKESIESRNEDMEKVKDYISITTIYTEKETEVDTVMERKLVQH